MTLFGKPVDTVIKAATVCTPARQFNGVFIDIDAREMDSGIGSGKDVAGQSGATADITAGYPFMGC
jgi:hypothetical protein